MRKNYNLFIILFLILSIFITSGFTTISNKPQTLYRIYIKGESLGLIKSKIEFFFKNNLKINLKF